MNLRGTMRSAAPMRAIACCLCLALAGCTAAAGAYQAKLAAADDAKCREVGLQARHGRYGNYRLKLEEIRAINYAAAQKSFAARRTAAKSDEPSTTTYMNSTTGRMTTCTGTAVAKTCF